MNSSKTVVYGEASESDSEEITLDQEDNQDRRVDNSTETPAVNQQGFRIELDGRSIIDDRLIGGPSRADIGTSLFASISSATSLAKIVNYSSYNLLTASGPFATIVPKKETEANQINSELANVPILHRTLYAKNQQLAACLTHLQQHPYEKAAKDFHTISQRLVGVQKAIQDANTAVVKLKREQKNLDFDLRMIG